MNFLKRLLWGNGKKGAATHYFWVGEHVVPLLADDKRAGQVERLLNNGTIEVDWYSGHTKGLTIESEDALRLDPTSTSNRNPYLKDDLVMRYGTAYRVTGIWDERTLNCQKTTDDKKSLIRYEMQVSEVTPSSSTIDHMKLRAARVKRAPTYAKPMAACPKCNAMHVSWTLERLNELNQMQNRPIGIVCENCGQLTLIADWFSGNKIS